MRLSNLKKKQARKAALKATSTFIHSRNDSKKKGKLAALASSPSSPAGGEASLQSVTVEEASASKPDPYKAAGVPPPPSPPAAAARDSGNPTPAGFPYEDPY